MAQNRGNTGCSLTTLLLVLFVALKLTGHISWPWLWVLAPAWIPLLVGIIGAIIIVVCISKDKGIR